MREYEHNHGRDDKDQGISLDKGFSVIVNGRKKIVDQEGLTFDEVVTLAFDNPPTGEFICFTITYRHAGGRKPEGTLIEGKSVKIKDGTIFNVTATDKS